MSGGIYDTLKRAILRKNYTTKEQLQEQVSVLYAAWDPLSCTVGWGYKSYFTGWYSHTDYFTSKNINNVVKIVQKIIK